MTRVVLGRTRKWVLLGVAIATALAFAGGAVFLTRTHFVHRSVTRSLALARVPVLGSSPAIASPALASSPADAPLVHSALFIGASYTQGLGAVPETNGYAYVIGRQPGWQTQVEGVAGTGFLNPGPRGDQTFAQRLVTIVSHPRPDLIVFQGGRNDTSYPLPKLRTAILATVALARQRFAGAQIVFLGPIPARVPVPPEQLAVVDTLRTAAAACKVEFIDPVAENWITAENERGYEGNVPAHPDNTGYAYIAQRLSADLDRLLAKSGKY